MYLLNYMCIGDWSTIAEVAREYIYTVRILALLVPVLYLGVWNTIAVVAREYPSILALLVTTSWSLYSATNSD